MTPPQLPRSLIGRLAKFLEDSLLVTLLVALIVIATSQIVMRNFFSSGFTWSDELLRLLVLWLAMAAAIAAARDDRHIAIDVLSRFMKGRPLAAIRCFVAIFTAVICGFLAWHAGRFVHDSRAYEDVLLGGAPAWIFQAIMPVAFGLMTWRYLIHALRRAHELIKGS
ncbi:MAG: TRAP transporter small permease subunit [Gammaproteobacteria bacterium]|nr:TRAP transporter small permease subunit [Gammaproteobacteria bacterium]